MESLFFDVVPAVKMAPKLHEVETFQILGPYRSKMIGHLSDIVTPSSTSESKIFTPTEMLIVGLVYVSFEAAALR